MSFRVLQLGIVALLALGVAAPAAALPGGIASTNCNGCHGGGSGTTSASIALSPPAPVLAGSTVTITVSVTSTNPGLTAAGYNLSLGDGQFENPPGAGSNRPGGLATQSTHSFPETSGTWTISWTAPNSAGNVDYTLWGNRVNQADGPAGDRPVSAAVMGSISVVLAQGESCTDNNQCGTGFCVDDVCCENACDASCRACSVAAGGQSSDGTCSLLVPGESSSAECCTGEEVWDGAMCVASCVGNNCSPEASCVPQATAPFFSCECTPGTIGSGVGPTGCTDIDECAEGSHTCDENEVCINNFAAPNDCICAEGLSRIADGEPCDLLCGDGLVGPGERCDDGNARGRDGCSSACTIETGWACAEAADGTSLCQRSCGDGVVGLVEECDDGLQNHDTRPNACRTNCRRASCGDGIVDSGELCDTGPGALDCTSSCQSQVLVEEGDGGCQSGGGGGSLLLFLGVLALACLPRRSR